MCFPYQPHFDSSLQLTCKTYTVLLLLQEQEEKEEEEEEEEEEVVGGGCTAHCSYVKPSHMSRWQQYARLCTRFSSI